MDKLRVLKHYAFQEVTAELLNSIADSLFAMQDGVAQAFIAGFINDDHLIFQDLEVTIVPLSLSVTCGLKGVFLYRTDSENCVVGVYKGTRIDKLSPYTEETLVFDPADATHNRIDIIEAEIVDEDDVDYYDTVQLFDTGTESSYAALKYVRRVRNVKLYVKTGVASVSPVAPTATPGRFTLREVLITQNVNTSLSVVSQTFDPSQSLWSIDHNVIQFPSIYEVIQYAKTIISQNRTYEIERHAYKTIPGRYTASAVALITPPASITELTVELGGGGGGGSAGGASAVINDPTQICGQDGTDSTIALLTGKVLMRAPGGKGGGTKYSTTHQLVTKGGAAGGVYGQDGQSGVGNLGGRGGGEFGGISSPASEHQSGADSIAWGTAFMAECGQIPILEKYLAKKNRQHIYIVEDIESSYSPGVLYGTTLRQTNLKADVGLLAMIPASVGLRPGGATYFIREMYMFYNSRIDKVDVESGATVSYPCNLTGLVKALPGKISGLAISLQEVFLVFPTKICRYAPGTPTIYAGSDTQGDITGPNRLSARFINITAATYNTSNLDEIYVGDNYKIKRIPLNTDVVETVIGTGVAGYSNDPVGTNAQIQIVFGLVVIGTNLYVADGVSSYTYANIRVSNLLTPGFPMVSLCGGGTTPMLNVYGTAATVRFMMIRGMYSFGGGQLYVIAANSSYAKTLDKVLLNGNREKYLGEPTAHPYASGSPTLDGSIESLVPRGFGLRGCGGAGGAFDTGVGGGGGGSSKVVGKITIPPGSTLVINLGQGGQRGEKAGMGSGYSWSGGFGYAKISW